MRESFRTSMSTASTWPLATSLMTSRFGGSSLYFQLVNARYVECAIISTSDCLLAQLV